MRAFKIWVCRRPDATVMKWLILQKKKTFIFFKTYDIKEDFLCKQLISYIIGYPSIDS